MAVDVFTIPRGRPNGVQRTPAVAWPSDVPVLTLQANVSDVDQLDPAKTLLVRVEVSVDGGRAFRTLGGFTWSGGPSRNQRDGFPTTTQPSFGIAAPPAGSLVRLRVESTDGPDVGWTVRGLTREESMRVRL